MALHSLYCADVPLRNCSLTHSSIVLKSTTAYTHFIKMTLHLKSSDITSMSYVQTIITSLAFTVMDPKWVMA